MSSPLWSMYVFLHLRDTPTIPLTGCTYQTSARSTAEEGLIKRTGRLDEFGEELYLWKIGKDEERRLTTLLKQDFYDVGVEGTYTNSAPHKCSHCGKETEFIDW